MKYSVQYNRVESVKLVLDESDLRRAALEHAQRSGLWPKSAATGKVAVEFGDTDKDGEPSRVYCEITVTFSQELKQPESAGVDGGAPLTSNA